MTSPSSFDHVALRHAREAAGLTQAALARKLGLAGGERVSEWERGVTSPGSPARLRALARALDVPVSNLLTSPAASAPTLLRQLRITAGLTREALAERVHVSITTVERWERGDFVRPLSAETTRLLAKALRRPIGDIRAALTAAARPATPHAPTSPHEPPSETDTASGH